MITRSKSKKQNEEKKILPQKRDREGNPLENKENQEDKKEEVKKEEKKEEINNLNIEIKENIKKEEDIKEDEKDKKDIKEDEKEDKKDIKEDKKEKENSHNCILCLNDPFKCEKCREERRKNIRQNRQIELKLMDSPNKLSESRYSHKIPLLSNPYPDLSTINLNLTHSEAPIPINPFNQINTATPDNQETNRRNLSNLLFNLGLHLIYIILFIYTTIIFSNSGGFSLYSTTSLYIMILGLCILIFLINTQNYFKNK